MKFWRVIPTSTSTGSRDNYGARPSRPSEKSAIGLAGNTSGNLGAADGCSLSQREKLKLREVVNEIFPIPCCANPKLKTRNPKLNFPSHPATTDFLKPL
jgi:hypothetical protein